MKYTSFSSNSQVTLKTYIIRSRFKINHVIHSRFKNKPRNSFTFQAEATSNSRSMMADNASGVYFTYLSGFFVKPVLRYLQVNKQYQLQQKKQ